jgi:DNA-binding NarL/FixJ family response regulator
MRSLQAGAVGYVLKEADNDELLRAIAAAARGEALLDPVVTARLISKMRSLGRQADEDAFHSFTQREMTILAELSLGKTNAEIAHALNLSEKTVRNQVSTMLDKLNLSNRVELATYAVEHHIYDRVAKS